MEDASVTGAKFAAQIRDLCQDVGVRSGISEADLAANPQLAAAVSRLQVAVEELHVTEEELRQQNDELAAGRDALEAQAHRYQDLFEFAPDAYLVTTLDGAILEANAQACKFLNAQQEYLLRRPLAVFVPEDRRRPFREELSRLPQVKRIDDWELRLTPHKSDEWFDAAVTVCVTRSSDHQPALRWMIRDVSDRKRAERQLQEEQRFLKQLIQSHERDRQLMAYEIHDGLAQLISGALLHLESIGDDQRMLSRRAQAELGIAVELMRRTVEDSRRLISGLRPPVLDEHGIVMAIEYLIAEHSPRGKLTVQFTCDVNFERLEPLLECNLFRIVQEALTNAERHSQAGEAVVSLNQVDGRIRLQVRDGGVGFDPAKVAEDRFGLQGIRKRAALMGGSAKIESALGQGTRVDVDLPVLEPADTQ